VDNHPSFSIIFFANCSIKNIFFFFAFQQTGYTNAPVIVAANASILGGKGILTLKKDIVLMPALTCVS
jgi:hypothetical protein